jgi:hypothetical protein
MIPRPWPLATTGRPRVSAKRRAASSARSAQTSEPSTSTGRSAWPRSRATAARSSGSGSGRVAGAGSGISTVAWENIASRAMSRNTGPRWGSAARSRARPTRPGTSATSPTVPACLVTVATSGGWSSSWRLPAPQRPVGALPPRTRTGDPLKWAVVTALIPLVTPGPAVSTASPGRRSSLAMASAANTAVCSCRTSTSRSGGSPLTAPSYSGNTCPPERVNISSIPCRRATATASAPPCPSRVPPTVTSHTGPPPARCGC